MSNRNTPTASAGCGDQLWLLAFVAVSLAIFWPSRNAGFVVDWLGWQMRYEAGSWLDVPKSFGYQALQPVLQFCNYLMFRVFQTEGLPWYLLFATISFAVVAIGTVVYKTELSGKPAAVRPVR